MTTCQTEPQLRRVTSPNEISECSLGIGLVYSSANLQWTIYDQKVLQEWSMRGPKL